MEAKPRPKGCVVGETYNKSEHRFDDDELVAYHTPGHARGVTSYFWKNEGCSVLFTGDTLYLDEHGRFQHGPLQFHHAYPGNIQDMIDSFQLYLRLNPTYVVPGLTQSNEFVTRFDAQQIQGLIDKLKRENPSSIG